VPRSPGEGCWHLPFFGFRLPPVTGRSMNAVFVTGGTGYIGRTLIATLRERGHGIYALVRAGSEAKLPAGAVPVVGDALDLSTFDSAIPAGASAWSRGSR
jgi:nucleoside-diphosphate-sugar epimerase